jgi:4-amino-4-deoxy-L-arabinose transferase-like glycosyltransferase
MELSWLENFLQNKRSVWIVGALTIILFLIANLPWQLDDYDQAKQAFTSFEMIKDGRWFYQPTPHEHVATKPPLIGWISAGLFGLTRSWEVAWRLPSFLAAIAMSILLFRAAAVAYGSIAALIALSAFSLNLLSPRLATLVRTDMPMAFIIFLIGLLIWQNVRHGESWNVRDRLSIFALLTAAMLIKGPIAYAFLLPGIAAFELWRRKNNAPSAWCGWWPWVASLGIFLLWVVGGIVFQPGFLDEVVVREFAARFGETIHRPQPLYFYLPHLLHKFAPWSVLIIVIALLSVRFMRSGTRNAFGKISPETFWLLCWSLGGLLAMSLIPSKRVDRIFPVVPPLCLLLAAQVGKAFVEENLRARVCRWSAVALLLSILITSGYTISKVVSGYRDHRDALVIFGCEVRHEAEMHHWRYEAISARDEGMLLYLRKTHFIDPDRAVAEWNRGNIDALVISTEKTPALMRQLRDAALSQLKSNKKRDKPGAGYVLITH